MIDDNVPNGDFRNSVAFGLGRWSNGAGGDGPAYVLDGEVTATVTLNACGNSRSIVFVFDDLAGHFDRPSRSLLGTTRICYDNRPQGSIISNFLVMFELNPTGGAAVGWYTGSTGAPANRWDLRSVSTHESGHTTGWYGHFTGDSTCDEPISGDYQTMCEGRIALLGTEWMRTLGTHDLHTYEDAY